MKYDFDPVLRVKLLRPDAIAPKRATDGSAGYDLFLPTGEQSCDLVGLIPTGIAVEIPPGWVGMIRGRSSLPIAWEGTIDSDYRGEVKVRFRPGCGEYASIKGGLRIAQLVVVPCLTAAVEVVDDLTGTERGAGGFGSTGR